MELLVRMRNGLPEDFRRLTNSAAPGTGSPPWTRTPSMSVSQLSMALRSGMMVLVSAGGTAVVRADVPDRERTEPLAGHAAGAFPDELADHRHEPRIGARRARSGVPEAQLAGGLPSLVVQVPDHLEVVGHEPDRADHHVRDV